MEYIEKDLQLGRLAAALSGASLLAVDTEAAGYHRYHDSICLLQLSTRTDTAVVDTLAVRDLSPLEPLFAGECTEIVLHDADYDMRLLNRDHGMRIAGLFDTKIAAQFLGESGIGLANVVEKYLNVRMDKKHQRADWAQRPLPPALLEYAAEDTRHLPELRDRLRAELDRLGRLEWAHEEFGLRQGVRWEPAGSDDNAFLKLKNTRDLRPRQLAALRELYAWREGLAEERDVATFRVLSNEALVGVARAMPADRGGLEAVRAVPATLASRFGGDLLNAVRRANELPEAALPVRQRGPRRPPPDAEFDHDVDALKAARDRAADDLSLDRGFLMPRGLLEEIARRRPRSKDELREVPDVRAWQVEALGEELLGALSG